MLCRIRRECGDALAIWRPDNGSGIGATETFGRQIARHAMRAIREWREFGRCTMTRRRSAAMLRVDVAWLDAQASALAVGIVPEKGRAAQPPRVRLSGTMISEPNDAGSHAVRLRARGRHGPDPGNRLSPRTVDVDPHLSLATPVAGYPATTGASCDPAAGHPYIAAALPAPVTVRPYIAVRPWWRRATVVPGRRRPEARAVGIRRPAGHAVRAGRPVHRRRGLGRGGAEPAGADEGGGQSDGAQQRASIHGVSCSVLEAALH